MTIRLASRMLYVTVGLVFGVAAWVKLGDLEAFFSSLMTYEVFTREVALVLAWYGPTLEAVVALGLVFGLLRRGAALVTAAMLVFFIVLVAQGLARGLELDCGCFGENRLESGWDYALKIGQNLALLAGLGAAVWLDRRADRVAPEPVESGASASKT